MAKDFYITASGRRGSKTYEVRRVGSGALETYTDTRVAATRAAAAAQRELNAKRKGNPGRKTVTKTQRRLNASKRSKTKRMAKALQGYLKTVLPAGTKIAGAQVKKNPGGSITIIPVKLPRKK